MTRLPPRSRVLARPRPGRGFTLLLALGLIAMITVAVLVALRAVNTESNLQAHERRAREAFFAAEAGMAEARVVLNSLAGTSSSYSGVFGTLGNEFNGTGVAGYVTESGLPSDVNKPWFQIVPWTDYEMTRGTTGAGIDPSVTTANQELRGPDGEVIDNYPEPLNVRYRVFVVDDDDGDANRTTDGNNQIWIVSVGEVTTRNGGQPYRTIVRSLVTNGSTGGGGGGGYGLKRGDASGGGSYAGGMPDLTP